MHLRICTDGAARGNPGPAGIGVVVYHEDGTVVAEHCRFLGVATNNIAEYNGLIDGLTLAAAHHADSVEMVLDSELVVRQMRGEYKVKNERLAALHRQATALAAAFRRARFTHVPREQNAAADKLANKAIDSQSQS